MWSEASSSSSTGTPDPSVVRTHSALHVLKGAVVKVLGPRKTTSVHVSDGHGRLCVRVQKTPTTEQLEEIELSANRKVQEDADIVQFEMERSEAETHFGSGIYDEFPVPSMVRRLRLVRIPGWEANCCSEEHLEGTGGIGRIAIDKVRFREHKRVLEIEFHTSGSDFPFAPDAPAAM